MEDFQFPHEMGKFVSQEPHFQRIWQYYREHTLRSAVDSAVTAGKITSEDAQTFAKFIGQKHHLSVQQYVLAKQGLRPDLANDESFHTTDKVMSAIGMTSIPLSQLTAEPLEHQFWTNFDGQYQLNEISMREELPMFITDPTNRMKVEAIMAGRQDAHLEAEETKQLAA